MSTYKDRCSDLADVIKDYEASDLALDAAHVERWANQFPATVREKIVTEMIHVFKKSYHSRERVLDHLDQLVTSRALCGSDPKAFWQSTSFLRLQQAGNSQRELLALFEERLMAHTGLSLADC